ncbi:MAG: hypothetical protein LBD11_00765 [Candidatus Peribacteria bacterium]|jgi:hypothetical protein|nr:hypothetical protein [Candidatus Peribacteria bacterium]
MPNTKATCVSLKYKEYTFDTRCYNPGSEEEMTLSGEVITSALPAISIRSLLPNPSGKDNEKEEITLFWEGDGFLDELHLSPEFYLLINNKTKKKLNGILLPNQEIMIKGTFSFPNTASCVTLMKGTEPISDFCYGKAGEGVRFSSNNVAVSEIPNEEIAVVKKITLVKKDDQLCISYNKVVFGCKKIPNSTTEKNTKLLSFQNNYLAELEKYLKNNYSLLYYESDLKELFDLYSATKKEIKAGGYTFNRKGENFSLTNVASLRSTQYNQSASEYLV